MTVSKLFIEPSPQSIYDKLINLLKHYPEDFPSQDKIEQATGASWSALVKELKLGSRFDALKPMEKRKLVLKKVNEGVKNFSDLNSVINEQLSTGVGFNPTLMDSEDFVFDEMDVNQNELDDFGQCLLAQLENYTNTGVMLKARIAVTTLYKTGRIADFVTYLGELIASEPLMLLKELLFNLITQTYEKHANVSLSGANKSDQYDAATVAMALAPVEQELATLEDFSKRLSPDLSQSVVRLIERLSKDIDQVKKYPQAFRHFETLFIARLHSLDPILLKVEPKLKTIFINFIAALFNAGLILVGKLLPNKVCYGECNFFNQKSKTHEHLHNLEKAFPNQLAS